MLLRLNQRTGSRFQKIDHFDHRLSASRRRHAAAIAYGAISLRVGPAFAGTTGLGHRRSIALRVVGDVLTRQLARAAVDQSRRLGELVAKLPRGLR
jgi:hypothetical protein